MPPPATPPRPESAPPRPSHAPVAGRPSGQQRSAKEDQQQGQEQRPSQLLRSFAKHLFWHCVILAIYILPVFITTQKQKPTLDEIHILENSDINGDTTTLADIWNNDYWGRPLSSASSHKSWRPLSILLFRYLKGTGKNPLFMHRLVGIITHAAAAELVGILAIQWYQPPASLQFTLRILAKLTFVLHPTHVEVTANAANRPHTVAILCAIGASSPNTNYFLYIVLLVCGFLSCETFLFQTVGIVTTMVLVSERRRFVSVRRTLRVLPALMPRILTLGIITLAYLYHRVAADSLSIPEGLIRPAENPFFPLTGTVRFLSYLYTTSLHIYKQLDLDIIGFSHEYGHACIVPVESIWDSRLNKVWILFILFYLLLGKIWRYRMFYLYLAWTASLFPITGILKVGTFVSDRLVVPSTVPVAIAQSVWLFQYLTMSSKHHGRRKLLIAIWLGVLYARVYHRSLDWMDSVPLLRSSLRTCPKFAKAHMEMSKIYSSLYPELYDLKKARSHLLKAKAIDPNFCDVHHQFAIVAAKENKWREFENSLFKSLQCPYSLGGAYPLWTEYWTQELNSDKVPQQRIQENYKRYTQYNEQLKQLGEEQAKVSTEQPKHPFAWKTDS